MSALPLQESILPKRKRSVVSVAIGLAFTSVTLVLPCAALAQETQGMDHSKMDHNQMDHGDMERAQDPQAATKEKPISEGQHTDSMKQMDMGKMQGGKAPPDARDPDAYAEELQQSERARVGMSRNAVRAWSVERGWPRIRRA